ncbi:helix-turn-helix transcriptional regulator [Bacillus sp. JJ722]|uniref:helix-turn-helix transcriptional regulator n=1 Tax=Bacillus sp. JJ722 TaxID=3122973 RepID=UPI002FFEDC94
MNTKEMNRRNEYLIKRRTKRIKQIDIAKYIGISNSAISKYELGNLDLIESHVQMYQKFIDEYQIKT